MKLNKTLAACAVAVALSACASQPTVTAPHQWGSAVRNAVSCDQHLRLAEHYEDIAKTLETDAQEEREMLDAYQATPWKYGKRIHDLKARGSDMVSDLEKAIGDSRKMAEFHRQMATEAKK
ncbi:MAG: hypothetical protein KGZ80_00555 [Methylomonas sp.]|nr:hypothetical protein [Methylomonas sp.]PPD22353.1 MAG: hypothetical protein CTY23_01990 [Methylomonas sp.]PPD26856.1 MAG: hypothetical protein CTY22_03725 [Methylomonas sp.]PPD38763.1 MAG: hypothetical protein CTY21_03725 [Methylomonas sp.]PPD40193.1 MAG: hypothetical protein CTY17_07040 [Methylomonas sp.]